MCRADRLIEMFGTEKPAAMKLREWLRNLRLADAYWAKHPRIHEIRRLNYDMEVARYTLIDLGGSGA